MRIANEILVPELERLLKEGKDVRFTPSGVSMRPFIEGDRDSVVLTPFARAPKRGDIVLARATNSAGYSTYVLHRIVRIQQDRIVLEGDGNIAGEEHCRRSDLIGLVRSVEKPNGKRKPLTGWRLWLALKPARKWLLKIYRKLIVDI